jgi:tRNA U34 2-thiouridine synthase MnmA/TrmU
MKFRRHHNNKGVRQIKHGRTIEQVKRIANKLGIPYKHAKIS